MIKAIFFDLDGTIRHNDPRGSDVFAEHAAALGLRIRADDRLRAMRWEHYYWANSRDLRDDQGRYGRMSEDFWRRYSLRQLVALGASSKQALEFAQTMTQYMSDAYKPRSVVPDELHGVLKRLQESDYPLGVISNRDKPIQDEIAELGLAPYFAFSLASGEIGAWKPEPEIFDDPECAVIKSFAQLARVLGADGAVPNTPRSAGQAPVTKDTTTSSTARGNFE
jgi:FMN phosphatase YigB (HAD superfamily)